MRKHTGRSAPLIPPADRARCTVAVGIVGIYYFEHDRQPELFASVFHSLWWAFVTLTTVGYGDVYPIRNGRQPQLDNTRRATSRRTHVPQVGRLRPPKGKAPRRPARIPSRGRQPQDASLRQHDRSREPVARAFASIAQDLDGKAQRHGSKSVERILRPLAPIFRQRLRCE